MIGDELATHPAPYTWMAVLSYAADLGWGINPSLTPERYETGVNLWGYNPNIRSFGMHPIALPVGAQLPGNVDAPGGNG